MKKNILGDSKDDEGQNVKLNINKEFAKKFEDRKQREHLSKAKQQYGESKHIESKICVFKQII